MNIFPSHRRFLAMLVAIVLATISISASAQCNRTATTTSATTVHSTEPTFSTAGGWQLSEAIATLPAGTAVSVCESRELGLFGIGSRTWLRIQFDGGRSGWIYAGTTDLAVALPRAPNFSFGLISDAVAGETDTAAAGLPGAGLPGSGLGRWLFLMAATLFVLLGIVGKLVYDEVGKTPLRKCMKLEKCIKAIIAAPLALAAFLQVGDFTLKNETAILVCLCMAFQNGFFWQTLLPPASRVPTPKPA